MINKSKQLEVEVHSIDRLWKWTHSLHY